MSKKTLKFICILLSGLCTIFTFAACSNFMAGSDLCNQLEQAVEYANSPFVNVKFSYEAAAITKMSPSGSVENKYKVTDVIPVECEEKDEYQFIKWTCNPSNSVSFEPENSNTTKAKILNGSSEITISPVTYKRPIPVVTPSGPVAVEKNSAISIAFEHEMNNTDEDLEKIDVSIDGESIKNHFSKIKWSDDKKTVWFAPDENNLIDLQSGTKTVTITIPADAGFNYLADGNKIVLKNDFVATYKINSETSDKLELKISHTEFGWGSCSLVGNVSLNIEQSQTMLFNINKDFAFVEWQVKFNGELQTPEQYSKYLIIDNPKSPTITVTAKKHAAGYEIVPYCVKRPSVLTHSPAYSISGVLRDTRLKFFFNQKMSDSSIYWTEAELKELLGENYASYKFVKAEDLKNENGEQYYYAYWDGQNASSIVFKNIEFYERGTINNYLQYYGMPHWDNGDNTILVMLAGNADFNLANPKEKLVPPEMKDIEFIISSLFTSENGIPLTGEYTSCYRTNSVVDNEGPEFGNSFKIKTDENELRRIEKEVVGGKEVNKIFISETEKPEYTIVNYHYLKSTNAVFEVEGTVNDAISRPAILEVKLTQIGADGYPKSLNDSIVFKRDLSSDDSGKANVNGIKFDFSTLNPERMKNVPEGMEELPEGMYEVEITAYDGNENPTVHEKTYRILYDNTAPVWNDDYIIMGGVGGHAAGLLDIDKLLQDHVFFNFPEESYTKIGSSHSYGIKEFTEKIFAHETPYPEIKFELYDYAGNKVEKTIQLKDIQKGWYCYELPDSKKTTNIFFWTENQLGEYDLMSSSFTFDYPQYRVLGPEVDAQGKPDYKKVRIYKEKKVDIKDLSVTTPPHPYGENYQTKCNDENYKFDKDCGSSISEEGKKDENNSLWKYFSENWYLPTENEFSTYAINSEISDLFQAEGTAYYLYAANVKGWNKTGGTDSIKCLRKYDPSSTGDDKWSGYGKFVAICLEDNVESIGSSTIFLPMMQIIDCNE